MHTASYGVIGVWCGQLGVHHVQGLTLPSLPTMRYVALLRAVNVGKRRMKMDDLRTACGSMGLSAVSTYIQSGNVIFESRRKEASLQSLFEQALSERFGFEVPTMIRSAVETRSVAAAWPFPEPKPQSSGFVGFLVTEPTEDAVADIRDAGSATDDIVVIGRHLYWLRGDRDTKFDNARVERSLGVTSTLRNLTVTRALADLADTP